MNFFKNLSGLNSKKANVNINDDLEQNQLRENSGTDQWFNENCDEGQLAIDVYQTKDAIIVKSTIAGVKAEDIDISINNDMLTVRGTRKMNEEISEDNYFYQECYWGAFSRSVILPIEVKTDKIEAAIENGVLTITLPKAQIAKQISVKVKD
ncbi:MAG: Hsp20/alpha crystallin family protein [Patescibacteria group bacterium]|jgi:HSP20 family protein